MNTGGTRKSLLNAGREGKPGPLIDKSKELEKKGLNKKN